MKKLHAAGVTALAVAGLATAGAASRSLPASAAAPTAPSVGFAVPTVVDQYRPGYEPDNATVPDIAGDPYSGSTLVSMPNGFSTTMSYIWRSDDNRQTFHPVEGNVYGKPTNCIGGGDSEMQVDPVDGNIFFADLQGLTNFSNSVSTDAGHTWTTTCTAVPGAGVDRQWEAIDDNGGTSAVAPGANGGRVYFDYDNVDQDATGGGNQLVMNESANGVNFGAYCQGTSVSTVNASACPAPPAMISPNETIPGNVVVDNIAGNPFQHRVYAIHTGNGGTSVVMSYCSGAPGDNTAATVAQDCTDPTQFTPGQNPNDPLDRTNKYWKDAFVQVPGSYTTGSLFPSVAIDTAGNLYATWAQYPTSGGNVSGPGAIMMSISKDGAQTWSKPVQISQPFASSGINETVMPWITVGDPGRVGVAYYAAADPTDGNVGPDGSVTASWNLFYAYTQDGLDAAPAWSYNQVNEVGHPIKFGDISTGGLGGAEDRSLGDFFQVHAGPQGQAIISYVDDTSADRNVDTCGGCGETPPEAAGPVMVATQNSGPGLFAADTVPALATNDKGSVTVSATQAAKDAFLAQAGQDIPAAANQQLTGATASVAGSKLVITLHTADPNLARDLSVSPTLGGPIADWMVRWAAPAYADQADNYAKCPTTGNTCDGNIFYVGMESVAGQSPTYFSGTTQGITDTHVKYLVYPATDTADVKGSISGGTITWTVPLSDVGSPAAGQGLYSLTGFTSTQLTPTPTSTVALSANGGEAGDFNIPQTISSTPAFDFIVPAAGGGAAGGEVPEAPLAALLVVVPLAGIAVWRLRKRGAAARA